MQMNDSQRIPASKSQGVGCAQRSRHFPALHSRLPILEMSSPTEMTATVVLKVGPVKSTFSEGDADRYRCANSYRIIGEGAGGVAGFAKGGAKVRGRIA